MDAEEQHYLLLIENEKKKMRPGLTGQEIDSIENEIMRLKGLLERYRRETGKKTYLSTNTKKSVEKIWKCKN